MSDEKIIVGISQGDINGIGMEVIIKTFLDPQMLETLFRSKEAVRKCTEYVCGLV